MKKTCITSCQDTTDCWLIPSSINLEKTLLLHPPRFGFKPKLDFFYHLIDAICRSMDYLDPKEDCWVRLSAKRLQKFNDNYKLYLTYLKERGIITVSEHYQPGKQCKSYRIDPWFLTGKPVEIPVSSDAVIRKKVMALQQERKENISPNDGYEHLSQWFNEKLSIDATGAKLAAAAFYNELKRMAFNQKLRLAAIRGQYKTLSVIKRYEKRDFFYHNDQNIGRYHTNITNTKREIRNFLTYDGQTLVNIDIKNSQPLFGAILLNPRFYKREENFSIHSLNILPHHINNIKKLNNLLKELSYYIMLGESSPEVRDEFDLYRKIVQGGLFYEEFFKLRHPDKPFTANDKSKVKEAVFLLLFSDNRKSQWHRKQEAPFKEAFPTVYKIFTLLKRHNKRILSHLLQRIESHIIIETVSRRIAAKRPDLPIYTIHDSIATTQGNEAYVQRIIEEEVKAITGLSASIGKEHWTPTKFSQAGVNNSLTTHMKSHKLSGIGPSGKAA